MSFQRIPFSQVRHLLGKMLKWPADSVSLLPLPIVEQAKSQGFSVAQRAIPHWEAFEQGTFDYSDKAYLNEAFQGTVPKGNLVLLSDECHHQKEAYELPAHQLLTFVTQHYTTLHRMELSQPLDCLILHPDQSRISIIYHEGYSFQVNTAKHS